MELVYLWVEEYKNIKEQGFNFNQNINCTFDYEIKDGGTEDGVFDHKIKLGDIINGTLDVSLKEDNTNVFNIFPPNINVTAIIGKNGSGKSSILEFILLFLTQEKHLEKKYRGILVLKDNDDNFIVYSKIENLLINGDDILHSDLSEFKITDYNNQKELNKLFQSLIFPYLNYSLTYHDILNYTSRMNDDEIKLHFPMIPDKRYGTINIVENDRNIEKIILNTYKVLPDKDKLKIYKDFFTPKYLEVYVNYQQILKDKDKLVSKIKDEVLEKIGTSKEYFENGHNKEGIDLIYDVLELKSSPQNFETTLKDDYSLSQPISLYDIDPNHPHAPLSMNTTTNFSEFKKDTFNSVRNNEQTQIIMKFDIEDITIDDIQYLTALDFPFFDIEVVDETGKKYSSLSFGERQLIALINQVFWFGTKEYKQTIIRQITPHPPPGTSPYNIEGYDTTPFEDEEEVDVPIDKYIILLDEVDLSFHPEWQQRTLSYLLEVLGKIEDKSFHLIFTSHSPFLLSDIPKENVIFLDKYIEKDDEVTDGSKSIGNCKVVDGLANKDKTFAANIHTLLSDSFFMNNNLMGEFSRTKIKSIIKFHRELEEKVKNKDTENMQSNYEDKKDEFAYTQRIIGDEYIANVIQNHIDEIERIVYGQAYTERYKEKEIMKLIEKFGEDEVSKFLGSSDD